MHSPTDFGFLTKRIEKLERQNRWFKIGAMLAVLIVGSLLLIAARPANVQTAEKFVVVDASGRTIAILGARLRWIAGIKYPRLIVRKRASVARFVGQRKGSQPGLLRSESKRALATWSARRRHHAPEHRRYRRQLASISWSIS